jgi:vitamin B12 transporter
MSLKNTLLKLILIFSTVISTFSAKAELEITIPVQWLYPTGLSTSTVNVDTVWPKNNSNSFVIGDVLNTNSAITSIRSGGKGQQTSVFTRGTNSNHTLFLINGSPITDHSTTNGLFDAGIDPVEYSTGIDVYKGSQSTFFGSGAIGGAVNINTAPTVTDEATLTHGSNNTKGINVNKGWWNNSSSYSIKATQDESDGYSVVKGGDKDGYFYQTLNFDSEHFVNNGMLKSTIVYRNSETELDGSGVDDADYTSDAKFYFYQMRYEGNNWNWVADYGVHDRQYVNGAEIDDYDSDNKHTVVSYTDAVGSVDYTIGTDLQFYSAQFENRGSYNSSVDKKAENYATFINADWEYNKFVINGGVRRDWNTLHDPVSTYRLGSSYKLNDIMTLVAGTSTGYKAPTLYEMYGADNFGYTGNPDLKEEKAVTYEIGIKTYTQDKWYTFESKSMFFTTEITDQINYSNSTYTNDTDGKTKINGWDFSSRTQVDNSSLKIGLMYVSAQDSTNTQLTRRPWWQANIGLDHQINDKLNIWYDWQYYGKHRDIHPTTYTTVDREYQHFTNVGADYLVDDNLLIKASIENVTNLDFERPYGYKQPERTFSISLKYLF